jgi:hypothetical protein
MYLRYPGFTLQQKEVNYRFIPVSKIEIDRFLADYIKTGGVNKNNI